MLGAMQTDPPSWREQIRRDFGLDLPVGKGGTGRRDDALVILAADPHVVAMTQMLVLRCAGMALGRSWRVRRRTPLDAPWSDVDQVQIEIVELTDEQIVTTLINCYFDVGAMARATPDLGEERRLLAPAAYIDRPSGIVFPYQLGWLHFDEVEDYAPARPDLGRLLGYTSPCVIGSVYVYDKGIGRFPATFDAGFLAPEFDTAVSEVMQVRDNVVLSGGRTVERSTGGIAYLRQDFTIGEDLLSALALAAAGGHYVKVRSTWRREMPFDDIGNEFIDAVYDLTSSGILLQ
jgi:hypothetical protein